MRVLDLFSGIGGFSLGLERAGMQTVAFCEIDPFCRKVLRKHWPDTPIFSDIKKVYRFADDCIECPDCGEPYCELCSEHFADCECIGCSEFDDEYGTIDVIAGGFPCQPFSLAGASHGGRAGSDDDRHLWPEMFRLVRALEPNWFIGENVVGIIGMELDQVLSDLESCGYSAGAFVIPACAVDAPHIRQRVWILAYSSRVRLQGRAITEQVERASESFARGSASGGIEQARANRGAWPDGSGICRVADGIPDRVDRLKALGNAVVPQVVEVIGRAIMECEA